MRSDNLLLNSEGILKLADFSNAIKPPSDSSPTSKEIVGVPYWQAPEIRRGLYNVFKVDIWSLGATIWECAEAKPPFSENEKFAERWPPLTRPKIYPPAFHEFLKMCSEPMDKRPGVEGVMKVGFCRFAVPRADDL